MAELDDVVNGRWLIVEAFKNESGQGDTFKVTDLTKPESTEKYVIKLLKKQDEKALARFESEIKASLNLRHPNIVNAIDAKFEGTPLPYLVTSYCSGGDLSMSKLSRHSLLEKLNMFREICAAVAFAHENHVIHRDIKPRNIFLYDQKAKIPVVGDFGLCFFHDENSEADRHTAIAEKIGGVDFRPPEAELGLVENMQPSFDVYSLGKLLYWFLSDGKYLPREYFDRGVYDLREKLPVAWIHHAYEIFHKSIREDPSDRFKDADVLLNDVSRLIEFVENDARYLDCGVTQQCVFCRIGSYKFVLDPDSSEGHFYYNVTRRFGFDILQDGNPVNNRQANLAEVNGILLGECGNCGNVQYFRIVLKRDESGRYKPTGNWHSLPKPTRY
jgi:serine/threonine protein kinase